MRSAKILSSGTHKKRAKSSCVIVIILGENLTAPPQEANGVIISPGLAGVDSHVPLGCSYTLCGHIINYQVSVRSYHIIFPQHAGN